MPPQGLLLTAAPLVPACGGQKLKLKGMMEMGGRCDKYTWGQTEKELCVLVPVAAHTHARHVRFDVTSTSIQ